MQSWHNLLRLRLKHSFCASTEHVLNVSLPLLIRRDGRAAPDRLDFTVPLARINTETYRQALVIATGDGQWSRQWLAQEGKFVYYVLSQSQSRYPVLSAALIARCAHQLEPELGSVCGMC